MFQKLPEEVGFIFTAWANYGGVREGTRGRDVVRAS